MGVDAYVAQRLYGLIMYTRHAEEPGEIDPQILVDADLCVLGASAERFQEYERQVRQEYSWVPDPVFRPARANILRGFLARRAIYHTPPFQDRYESCARCNLEQSLLALGVPDTAEP